MTSDSSSTRLNHLVITTVNTLYTIFTVLNVIKLTYPYSVYVIKLCVHLNKQIYFKHFILVHVMSDQTIKTVKIGGRKH